MSGDLPNGTTQADLDRHADERVGEPYASEDYQRFLAETAAECRACPDCWEVPCPACCAGGICDAICDCEERGYPEDYDGFPEDYDDG